MWKRIEQRDFAKDSNGIRPLEGRKVRVKVPWPGDALPAPGTLPRRWLEGTLHKTSVRKGFLSVSLWGKCDELTPELWLEGEELHKTEATHVEIQ